MPESEEQRRNRELIELWVATSTALIALTFLVLWHGLPLSAAAAAATRESRRAR